MPFKHNDGNIYVYIVVDKVTGEVEEVYNLEVVKDLYRIPKRFEWKRYRLVEDADV